MNNRILLANNLDEFSFINHKKGEISVLNLEQEYQHITCLQNKVLGYEHSSLIGKTNFKNQSLILFDLSHVNLALKNHDCEIVDGIIGADILKSGKAVIDYKKKHLYLKVTNKKTVK